MLAGNARLETLFDLLRRIGRALRQAQDRLFPAYEEADVVSYTPIQQVETGTLKIEPFLKKLSPNRRRCSRHEQAYVS